MDTPRRRHKRVHTDHTTPRRVVPESTESLSQGREESQCGYHCQASTRWTDRLLESHGAGNGAARKTQHSASASKSTEDLGEGHVIEPGGKTPARFHAHDAGLTLPSRSRREVNARFLGTFARPPPVEAAVGGVLSRMIFGS